MEILDVDLIGFERGDPRRRRAVVDGVRRSLATGFVYVRHDLDEAEYLADHAVLFDHGAIAQQGTIADLAERPAGEFVRRFFSAQHRRTGDA